MLRDEVPRDWLEDAAVRYPYRLIIFAPDGGSGVVIRRYETEHLRNLDAAAAERTGLRALAVTVSRLVNGGDEGNQKGGQRG